jgi:hypothetical protein
VSAADRLYGIDVDTFAEAGLFPTGEPDEFPTWLGDRWPAGLELEDGYLVATYTDDGYRLEVLTRTGVIRTDARFADDDLGRRMFVAAVAAIARRGGDPPLARGRPLDNARPMA